MTFSGSGSKFLVAFFAALFFSLPAPAQAARGMCQILFGHSESDRIKAELVFKTFALSAEDLNLLSVRPAEFSPIKRAITVEFIRRKLMTEDGDLNLSGRNLQRLVRMIYSKRHLSRIDQLKRSMGETYTKSRVDRRMEEELLTLQALRKLTDGRLLDDPTVEAQWRSHLVKARAAAIILNILGSSAPAYLPINPWTSLYLPASSLSDWKRVPEKLIDRALLEGLTPEIRLEIASYFKSRYEWDRAWDAIRTTYNVVTLGIAATYIDDAWRWLGENADKYLQ